MKQTSIKRETKYTKEIFKRRIRSQKQTDYVIAKHKKRSKDKQNTQNKEHLIVT